METELESLLIRLGIDASGYTTVLNKALEQLKTVSDKMEAVLESSAAEQAKALNKQAEAARKAAAAEQHMLDMIARGNQIYQSNMTVQERYKSGMLELNTLLKQGALDHESYNREAARLAKTLPQLSDKLESIGSSLTSAGQKLSLSVTTPIVAGLGLATREAANFEQALADLRAAAAPTEEQMARIRDRALEMSKELGSDPTQTVQSLNELLKAGMDLEKVLGEAGKSAIEFARVGELETAAAATVMADTMKVFNETAASTVDTLSAAADASSTSIREMVEAFSQASAVAANANQNLRDTSAAIAVLANNGIKGSDAGTSLKTMLLQLMAPADKAVEVIEKYNLQLRDATGNLRPMGELVQELEGKMGGLNAELRDNALFDLFGQDAIRAAQIFIKEGVNGFDKLKSSMTGALSVSEKYQIQTSTMKGTWEALQAALSRLQITIGEITKGQLTPLFGSLTEIVDKINEWVEAHPRLTMIGVAIAGIAAAAGPVLVALGMVVSNVGTLITTIQTLNTWLAANAAASGVAAGGLISLNTAALLAKAGLAALVVGGVAYLTPKLYEANEAIRALREEMERAGDLGGKGLANISREQEKILAQANDLSDPGDKKAFLAEQLERAKLELEGIKKNTEAQKALVDKMFQDQSLTSYLTGMNAPLDAANQELDHMKARLDQAAAFAKKLEEQLNIPLKDGTVAKGAEPSVQGDSAKKLSDLMDAGKKEMETNDPVTKYNARLKELDEMLKVGAVTQEYYNSQLREAKQLMEKGIADADPVKALTKELEKAAATFGMTTAEAKVYELAQNGATEAQLEQARTLAKNLKLLDKEKEATEKAKRIAEKYLTPEKKFAKAQSELKDLLDRKLISLEDYNSELAAQKAMNKELKIDIKIGGIDAFESDTAEAARKFHDYMNLRNTKLPTIQPGVPAPIATPLPNQGQLGGPKSRSGIGGSGLVPPEPSGLPKPLPKIDPTLVGLQAKIDSTSLQDLVDRKQPQIKLPEEKKPFEVGGKNVPLEELLKRGRDANVQKSPAAELLTRDLASRKEITTPGIGTPVAPVTALQSTNPFEAPPGYKERIGQDVSNAQEAATRARTAIEEPDPTRRKSSEDTKKKEELMEKYAVLLQSIDTSSKKSMKVEVANLGSTGN